jgi:hypothetical protein
MERLRCIHLNKKNIKYLSIIIIVFPLFFSCRDGNIPTSEKLFKDGKLYRDITCFPNNECLVIEYYPSGSQCAIFSLKDSIYNGDYISFYENGKIEAKGSYKNGIEEGIWYYYLEDGSLAELRECICTSRVNRNVYFTKNLEMDTTKINDYFSIQSIQDTIYFGEPYIISIKLYTPYFSDGMYIVLVDDVSEYCEIEKNNGFKKKIECKGFETTFAISDYQIGDNEVKGIIMNYDKTRTRNVPFYFSKKFYVKELPCKSR